MPVEVAGARLQEDLLRARGQMRVRVRWGWG